MISRMSCLSCGDNLRGLFATATAGLTTADVMDVEKTATMGAGVLQPIANLKASWSEGDAFLQADINASNPDARFRSPATTNASEAFLNFPV